MIKGKLALVTCALTLVFTSSLFAASDTAKVDTSPDGKIWTLTLKPGLKFSDGSPLTAEDVVFTYNKAAKSGGKIDMGNFSHARALDARRIEMTLSHPQSTFVNVLGSLGIVPASRYDEKTGRWPRSRIILNSGYAIALKTGALSSRWCQPVKRMLTIILSATM